MQVIATVMKIMPNVGSFVATREALGMIVSFIANQSVKKYDIARLTHHGE